MIRTAGVPESGRNPLAWLCVMLLLCVATGLQSSIAYRIGLWDGVPDFVLTVTLVAALTGDTASGAIIGFIGGLLAAAVGGQTVGTYISTRTLTAWLAAWTTGRFIERHSWVVVLCVFVGTFVAELLFLLGYPHTSPGFWVRSTLLDACFNAVLAIPVYLLLRLLGWCQQPSK
jgi:rod shape-determining protein MreD